MQTGFDGRGKGERHNRPTNTPVPGSKAREAWEESVEGGVGGGRGRETGDGIVGRDPLPCSLQAPPSLPARSQALPRSDPGARVHSPVSPHTRLVTVDLVPVPVDVQTRLTLTAGAFQAHGCLPSHAAWVSWFAKPRLA